MPGETVTVASRLPAGLILTTYEMIEKYDDGGKRVIKEARRRPATFTINGIGSPRRLSRENQARIVGGYAITENVPANIWNAWFKDNETSDFIINKLVFGDPKTDAVESQARNNAKAARSGLEPLNPEKIIKNGQRIPADPRIPHMIDPNDATWHKGVE